jgi:hypothetical protein
LFFDIYFNTVPDETRFQNSERRDLGEAKPAAQSRVPLLHAFLRNSHLGMEESQNAALF